MLTTLLGQAVTPGPVDTSGHTAAVLGAAALTAGLVLVLCLAAGKPMYKVVMGSDKRLSTSKAVSLAWTVFVAMVFLAQLFIALPANGDVLQKLQQQWDNFPAQTYLLLLGGPYAAVVLSRLATQTKLSTGDLQTVDGDGKLRAADLVSDDRGNVRLTDLQYTVFNVVALIFAFSVFVKQPSLGLPAIPQGIAALSSASALTYLGNKAVGKGGPFIDTTVPTVVAVGDHVTLLGRNFMPPIGPTDPQVDLRPTVLVAGIAAQVEDTYTATCVSFTVPAGVPAGLAEVLLNTAGKGNTKATTRLTVVERPARPGPPAPEARMSPPAPEARMGPPPPEAGKGPPGPQSSPSAPS